MVFVSSPFKERNRAMADLPSGASFYRSGLARATFVLGSYEINLNICSCVEVADRQALAEQWAADIVTDANAA